MSGKAAKRKGAQGEREFCKWLQRAFGLPEAPQRNLDQTRDGGADVLVPPFMFEVKRRQNGDIYDYWSQVSRAADEWFSARGFRLEPVVAYRANNQPWRFIISAEHLGVGCERGYIELGEYEFKKWAMDFVSKFEGAHPFSITDQNIQKNPYLEIPYG